MTYGWALLVVLAAIVAISTFGVQRIENTKPNMCFLEYPFVCLDSSSYDGNINFVIMNNAGKDSLDVNVTAEYNNDMIMCDFIPSLLNGQEVIISCLPPYQLPKGYVTADIKIEYIAATSGLPHYKIGQVSVDVH